MSIQLISIKCPDCGKTLSIEGDRTQAFCTYCGASVIIHNENEQVFRTIDEAGIKHAETEKLIKLKELEMEEKRFGQQTQLQKVLTVLWLVLSLIILTVVIVRWSVSKDGFTSAFLMLFYLGGPIIGGGAYLIFHVLPEKEEEKQLVKSGAIRFPDGLAPFYDKRYDVVHSALQAAGFTNVRSVNLHDLNALSALVKSKNGKIESVTVNGKQIREAGKLFMPDVPIVITYHGR